MRGLWILGTLCVACGGKSEETSTDLFRVEGVAIAESGLHQVVLTGDIVLADENGFGGTNAVVTFHRDDFGNVLTEANSKIGLDLVAEGDRSSFELSAISARLVPHEDGYDRLCVDLQVADSNYAEPVEVGCLDGTPDPTTPTNTTPAPEEPPTTEIYDPFELELFGLGETVDLSGRCTDPNQGNGTLQAVWTYEPTDGSAAATELTVDPIQGDGRTQGGWENPPLGDYYIGLECTDDNDTSTSDRRQISVVDRQLADLDNDGYSLQGLDCNDADASINPGADEACDNVDRDCSGVVDDKDLDGDGYVDEACGNYPGGGTLLTGDCDDTNAGVNPGATEVPADGTDQDCDGND